MTKKTATDRIPTEIKESAQKIWLAGLGAMQVAEEEGSKLFKNLVEKGKTFEGKGREAVDDVRHDVEEAVDKTVGKAKGRAEGAFEEVESRFEDTMAAALKRFGVPSRDEIATLTRRVEELTALVENMKKPAAKKPAARSTAKKPAAKATSAKTTAAKTTAAKAKATAAKATAAKATAAKSAASKTTTATKAATASTDKTAN